MNKKITAISVALIMASSLLAGCQSPPQTPAIPVTKAVAVVAQSTLFEQFSSQFIEKREIPHP